MCIDHRLVFQDRIRWFGGGGHPRSLSWWSAIEEPYDFHISLGEVKIILGGVICIGTSTYHISLGEVKVILG